MTEPNSGNHSTVPVSDIVAQLTGRAEALCHELLPAGHREGAEWRCGSVQGEPGKSLGVCMSGAKAGVWSDFGGDESGDLLDLVQACLGLDKGEAVRWAKGWIGIDDEAGAPARPPRSASRAKSRKHDEDAAKRIKAALAIWRASRPAPGTLAEDYLRGRGITIPIPATVRYHPGLKYADADTGLFLPCMVVAACNVDRKITGVQRIFLTHDGRKAPVNRPKMALGTLRGCAVRLAPTTDRIWLTEGVEDALAVVQMMQEPAWALLGKSNFKTVALPDHIKQVILAPDGDEAGQAVIQETAMRLAGQGREVRAAKLPPGRDWCDVLDDYEERAGILEFEMELSRPDAEIKARQETING